jgi:putative transcriptional regulator
VLYNRIAALRADRGLSRQQLAEAVGVNYQTIGYLERGDYNPSLDLAFRLSEVFEVPVEAVFSRSPMRPMSEELFPRRAAGA